MFSNDTGCLVTSYFVLSTQLCTFSLKPYLNVSLPSARVGMTVRIDKFAPQCLCTFLHPESGCFRASCLSLICSPGYDLQSLLLSLCLLVPELAPRWSGPTACTPGRLKAFLCSRTPSQLSQGVFLSGEIVLTSLSSLVSAGPCLSLAASFASVLSEELAPSMWPYFRAIVALPRGRPEAGPPPRSTC